MADEVDKNASFEGSIRWGIPGMGPWDDEETPPDTDQDVVFVQAFVRCGNDMGQGGAWVIGLPTEGVAKDG